MTEETSGTEGAGATERALRLTVLVGESDSWHHRPLYTEIVHRAHRAGWRAPACSGVSRASAPRR